MKNNLNERMKEINIFDKMAKNEAKYIPKNLMIEVTNACNSRCVFCANHKMTRKRDFIDSSIVTKALKQGKGIRDKGIRFIYKWRTTIECKNR